MDIARGGNDSRGVRDMQEIEKRLSEMSAAGASDLLLTVGARPQLRVLGNLRAVGEASLTAEDTRRMALPLLNTAQQDILEKNEASIFPGTSRDWDASGSMCTTSASPWPWPSA